MIKTCGDNPFYWILNQILTEENYLFVERCELLRLLNKIIYKKGL